VRLPPIEAVAEKSGWKVVKVYEDAGISGAKGRDQRPGLDASKIHALGSTMNANLNAQADLVLLNLYVRDTGARRTICHWGNRHVRGGRAPASTGR
jgi:hypothetical protein